MPNFCSYEGGLSIDIWWDYVVLFAGNRGTWGSHRPKFMVFASAIARSKLTVSEKMGKTLRNLHHTEYS